MIGSHHGRGAASPALLLLLPLLGVHLVHPVHFVIHIYQVNWPSFVTGKRDRCSTKGIAAAGRFFPMRPFYTHVNMLNTISPIRNSEKPELILH